MKRVDIDVEGTTVALWESGEGRPLVAIHGVPVDHHSVVGYMERAIGARDGWRRIYPDLPGFGETPLGEVEPSADHLLRALAELIEKITGPDEAVSLVGYSYGGYLALGLTALMPERVAGICHERSFAAIFMNNPGYANSTRRWESSA